MKLHLLGIPHTCSTNEYSHCAFTGKVLRFSPMMLSVGYEVIHYGNGDVNPGATKHEMMLSEFELENYKQMLQGDAAGQDKSTFVGDLANWSNIMYIEFNKRLKAALSDNLEPDDIICCPFGPAHEDAIRDFNNIKVETGIGYPNSYLPYRIFETNAWYQYTAGANGVDGGNYWFSIPNYFDVSEWTFNPTPSRDVVYFGRLYDRKGLPVVVEIAKHRPDLNFTICGQGDPTPYLVLPNIKYLPPLVGRERSDYLGNAMCTLMPTQYNEPFGGVTVESQLCGTPVLGTSYGSFTETIVHGFNGYRCHTLGDFLAGLDNIDRGSLNRKAISNYAQVNYGMRAVARRYDEVFQRLSELHRDGWYSLRRHF